MTNDALSGTTEQPIYSFEEFLTRFFPGSNPRIEEAVCALGLLDDEEVVEVLRRHRELKAWRERKNKGSA